MKRLGVILALALVLTIGGVYATFSYAQSEVDSDDVTIGHTIESKVTDIAKGTIKIESDFAIEVINAGSYKTGMNHTGTTTVTFTPATGADADVRDNGIQLLLTIEISGNTYAEEAIFNLTNGYTAGGVVLNGGQKVNGSIEVKLSDYIAVNEITLSTAAEYDAYRSAFEKTVIIVTVSEYVAA